MNHSYCACITVTFSVNTIRHTEPLLYAEYHNSQLMGLVVVLFWLLMHTAIKVYLNIKNILAHLLWITPTLECRINVPIRVFI